MANLQIERLRQLPQDKKDTWQGGAIRLPMWAEAEEGKLVRPVMGLWLSLSSGCINEKVSPKELEYGDHDLIFDTLVDFATNEVTSGCLPGKVQVKDDALANYLTPRLGEVGVKVELLDELRALNHVVEDLTEFMDDRFGAAIPGALSVPGVCPSRMHRFAVAAKQFYEASLWEELANEDLIQIQSPASEVGLRYVCVLGMGGQSYGLGFYDSPKEQVRQQDTPEAFISTIDHPMWSILYDALPFIPISDSDLWLDHDFPVADDENAYPMAAGYESKGRVRRPTPGVLSYLEGLMLALVASSGDEIDSMNWSKVVETYDGVVRYELSLTCAEDHFDEDEKAALGMRPDSRVMDKAMAMFRQLLEDNPEADIDQLNELANEEIVGKRPDEIKLKTSTALEEAEQLCYQAFEVAGRRRRMLAKKALKLSKDCVEAYNILAELTGNHKKQCELYRQGVEAGKRVLGKAMFEEGKGKFWGLPETRPYMRAKQGLAEMLTSLERYDEAIEQFEEMLELNEGDNQGVRYCLMDLLLCESHNDQAWDLYERYHDEDTALWHYPGALLAFRKGGDSEASRKLLKKAVASNRHAVKYLVYGDYPPSYLSMGYSLGSEEEASVVAEYYGSAWEDTPRAMAWLKKYGLSRKRTARKKKSGRKRK